VCSGCSEWALSGRVLHREARAHEVADHREVLAGGRPTEGRLELGCALAEAEVGLGLG
jgi:hypothetical protein